MTKPKIIVSPCSGFCFGVERAVNIAKKALKEKDVIYSLGPIIHNPQVVRELSEKGLKVTKDIAKVRRSGGSLLIPSHGIDLNLLEGLKLPLFDTTCPLVRRAQDTARDLVRKGYFIIIVGKKDHPEVKALAGMLGKKYVVVKNEKEAKKLVLKDKKVAVISQTTAATEDFKKALAAISKKEFLELAAFNTVCKDTLKRQGAARDIAGKVDMMLVIGGRQSSNTAKLAGVCRAVNKNTRHIESSKDLNAAFIKDKKKIGIATGASTPPYAVREVVKKINSAL